MKLQGCETFKFNDDHCVHQAVNSILRNSRIVANVATMEATKDNMTIKKNGVTMAMDTIKKGNKSNKCF